MSAEALEAQVFDESLESGIRVAALNTVAGQNKGKIPAIVEKLKGTKNIIVREGNVYIGKGRKDGKNIFVIPIISSNPATPNIIEYILSLNISFKDSADVPLLKKIKALGGKYNRLQDWILESGNFTWDDKYLNLVDVETLFGETAEKVVELITDRIE